MAKAVLTIQIPLLLNLSTYPDGYDASMAVEDEIQGLKDGLNTVDEFIENAEGRVIYSGVSFDD